ncbi:hypothetical protein QX233_13260 [Chryseobacterium gambrini]|uniref:Uncharacterized protein n=1 Tax=Chryseobacterium gambrini TaxID=373672 RepID=A0AAJ1R4H6_9FLAO|nr:MULTISPECIES: hypothetical protein [Chryseobacterium]MDN4013439.1 hypothetical protein [Chryseobacterium gambrini]QWA37804.1 hypothetical protein KKI44_18070 [Chryseobacterium sp. ZHDP1]
MKKDIYDYLIFKLDSEYADYEFDLISIPPYEFIENDLALEPYEYFGEVNKILEQRTKHILLYFNADMLMRVEFLYPGNIAGFLKQKLEEIQDIELPEYMMLILRKDTKFTVLMYQNKLLQNN